jgi:membrane protease YdiL (CAAX protease family)
MSEMRIEKNKKIIGCLAAIVFVGLLILRFPLIIIPSTVKTNLPSELISSIYRNGTYLLTAILILLEKDKLAQFKINVFAITIFLLAPVLKPIIYITAEKRIPFGNLDFSWIQIIISILLCLYLIFSHTGIQKDKLKYYVKWTVISILAGVITAVGVGLIYSNFTSRSSMHPSVLIFIVLFITQLTNAAVCEEPLFRGFMWGYLEKRGWKQMWIWLFQAGVFCLGHVYYLPQYPVFFIGTFVAALILGLLVWRSKSIGSSMIAHGIVNSLGDLIMHFTW